MPSVKRTQRVWMVRLSTLLSFVVALGWASSAFAAAPMCGVHAQTVAAPPIQLPTSSDEARATNPCDDGFAWQLTTVPYRGHEAPQPLVLPELPLRALPSVVRLAPSQMSARVSPAVAEHQLVATGFARLLERPPRA